MFSRSPLDWGLLLLYFGFLVAMWLRARRRSDDATEYLLAGRRITLPALVASLVATWYGGILGVGEYSYRYGLSNWLVFGAPYYLSALLFALFFAARARRAAFTTIPDLLDRHYGRGPALMGAVAVFVTSAPAAYVLMLGTLFAAMFGLPLVPCVVAATLFSVFYVAKGGLRTAVLADQVYFVLMYGGFALLVAFLVAKHGALPWQAGAVPPGHFTWNGGRPFAAIIVWYVIALSALVDPAFWQIANAARDPKTARRAVLFSIGFWFVFDAMTTVSGLYARALLPELRDPVFAFPELARATLPPVALGIFFLGMIATVMSTIDSYAFIAATTLGRDLLWRIRREPDESRVPAYTRMGLWAAGAFAVIVALANPSVISLWHDLGSITTPTLLLPVGVALLGRGRLAAAPTLAAMAIAFVTSLLWVLAKDFGPSADGTHYLFDIEPIYAGLGVSLAVYVAGWSLGWRGDRLPRAVEPTQESA